MTGSSIHLSPDDQERVSQIVVNGRFADANAAVSEGIRLLHSLDAGYSAFHDGEYLEFSCAEDIAAFVNATPNTPSA
jgi:Arc/MetJ-type ribon-helix-helix transcriptional regulator